MADKIRLKLQPVQQKRGQRVSVMGRPRKGNATQTGQRSTLPLAPGQKSPTSKTSPLTTIKRRGPFDFSMTEIDEKAKDLELLYDWLPLISPDVSLAVWLAVNLADSGWTLSVKNPTDPSLPAEANTSAVIDEEATAMAHRWLRRSGSFVQADFPGCAGSESTYIRGLLRDGALKGALASETVFSADFTDVTLFQFDPMTVEFRADAESRGLSKIGQRQIDAEGGWLELNPNLVTYYTLDGTLYGDSPMAPALYTLPYYVRFYQDAQLYLHNAAWGIKDAEVATDKLKEIWDGLRESERAAHKNDFLSWALDQASLMSEELESDGEADPDATRVHLDILKFSEKASAGNDFPLKDYRNFMKSETVNSVKTPAAMMNEQSSSNESFNEMQIGAYESFLLALQRGVEHIITRSMTVAFAGVGYDKEVFVEFKFKPVRVTNRLTEAQAEQLEILNMIKKRDENWVSQNEAARKITGTRALGPAPLSDNADPDGPSAPSHEIALARGKASDANGSASGPSFGGQKKVRDTDPAKDNRV